MRSTLRRRLLVAAGAGMLLASPLVPGLASSDAHPCAEARVWVNGSKVPVGSCHTPCGDGHFGTGGDVTHNGTGVGVTACAVDPTF